MTECAHCKNEIGESVLDHKEGCPVRLAHFENVARSATMGLLYGAGREVFTRKAMKHSK